MYWPKIELEAPQTTCEAAGVNTGARTGRSRTGKTHSARTPDRTSARSMRERLSEIYQQSKRNVLKEFIRVIDVGIAAGVFRPVDSRIAALGIIGILNWIAWWHRPGSPDSDRVTEQPADMAVERVLHDDETTQYESGPARAVATLRQNLDYLEHQFGVKR
jgi:Tetracyclin repressor-like, C-terminal domain